MSCQRITAVLCKQGPPGPPGTAGGMGYTHTQTVAATTWTVNHNLGRRPAISVLSPGGVEVLAEVLHASLNQVLVYFDQPYTGLVICS